jgi:ABC-type lipoprotein release transport system permease subunit
MLSTLPPLVLAAAAAASTAGEPPAILVTRQLAEAAHLSVGDVVSLSIEPSGTAPRPFRIAAIYEPTPDPMRLVSKRLEARLHLPDLLALTSHPDDPLASESVTAINVELKDPADATAFARDLSARVPGIVAVPTAKPDDDTGPFAVLERFHEAIAIVTVLGSTAFLLSLMVMRAEERRETVGILRLIGVSRGHILLEVLVEGLLIAMAGAAFGVLFALATQGAVNRFFQWRYDTTLVFVRVTAGIAWRCVVLAIPLGVLAGLVASWTLLRRDVVALLRR